MMELILTAAAATGCVLTFFLPRTISWHRQNLRLARLAQERFYSSVEKIVASSATPPRVRASTLRIEEILHRPFLSWIVMGAVVRALLGFSPRLPDDAESLLRQADRMSDELRDAFTTTCILGVAMVVLKSPICLLTFRLLARFARIPSSQMPTIESFLSSTRDLKACA